MIASGELSRLKRRKAPNAVTSSGPSHPHGRSAGIGATSRARSTDSRLASSGPGVAATSASVPIIAHMLLPHGPRRAGPPGSSYCPAGRWGAGRPGSRRMLPMAGREQDTAGVLTLAAVPIGRPEDASSRLAAELARATLIAAEDTRRVRWLAASLGLELRGRGGSYFDANRTRRTPGLLAE